MRKYFVIILFSLFFVRGAQAQKQDTLLYYVDKQERIVTTKDSADHFMLVFPPDSSSGRVLYPIREYYMTGKSKVIMTSTIHNGLITGMEGACIQCYPNGNRHTMAFFQHGIRIGYLTTYYPNGKIYTVERSAGVDVDRLIECRDTSGTILARNGNGSWLTYDSDFKTITAKGTVIDSLKNGEWQGTINDTGKYVCIYKNDNIISGTGYDSKGNPHPFVQYDVPAKFNSHYGKYLDYMSSHLQFPDMDKRNKTKGRLIIQFTIEKDGSVSHPVIIKSPSETLSNEAEKVVRAFPKWVPEMRYGMPVKTLFVLPLNFGY